jgi:hypothetical protein
MSGGTTPGVGATAGVTAKTLRPAYSPEAAGRPPQHFHADDEAGDGGGRGRKR